VNGGDVFATLAILYPANTSELLFIKPPDADKFVVLKLLGTAMLLPIVVYTVETPVDVYDICAIIKIFSVELVVVILTFELVGINVAGANNDVTLLA
jgi:hypothetical protein